MGELYEFLTGPLEPYEIYDVDISKISPQGSISLEGLALSPPYTVLYNGSTSTQDQNGDDTRSDFASL